jgi:hypothetical protein
MKHPQRGNLVALSEILTDLQVSLEDWKEWQAAGQTPLSLLRLDDDELIHRDQYERWLDSLTDNDTETEANG